VLFYTSANRDETVFTDPDRFDITRKPNPHVGFGGGGPHFCLGATLAKREIAVMFEALLQRFESWNITADPSWSVPGALVTVVCSLDRLPVRLR
jgi:methyl-branched lipid omega-hydroxylase